MTVVVEPSPKRKRTNSRWPSVGILAANRPGSDGPGGLGAEESGTERTGPTQVSLVAIRNGGRLAEVGQYYDSANDPVTDGLGWTTVLTGPGTRTIRRARNSGALAMALLQPRAVGAIMTPG